MTASLARQGLDRLLALFPDAEIERLDWQLPREAIVTRDTHDSPLRETLAQPAGPWVCVDLVIVGNASRFAIWKTTGAVYQLDEHGAVEDDPFLTVEPELTERERLVLAWDKSPEEWEDEYGGQYGAELVDAERKTRRIVATHLDDSELPD